MCYSDVPIDPKSIADGTLRVMRPIFYEKTGWCVELHITDPSFSLIHLTKDQLTELRDHLTKIIDFMDGKEPND